MDKKEVIVVFVLALLVLLVGTARLFSTPLPASPASRAKLSPLRGITALPRDKEPGDRRATLQLWPTLPRNLQPQDSEAAHLLDAAETIASEGLFDAAVAAYRRFIERFPKGHAAEFALLRTGQCYTLARRYRDAMASYEQFLSRCPDSGYRPLALLWSADAMVHLGYREPARKRLEEVVTRHPMSPFAEGARTLLDALDRTPAVAPKPEPEAPTP